MESSSEQAARGAREFPHGVAIVIGGSGGIGAAICRRLAAAGSSVALSYRSNEASARAVAESVRAAGPSVAAHAAPLEIEDAAAVASFVAAVESSMGQIHTVIHAAGSNIPMRFLHEVEPREWRSVIESDVNGFYNLVHATLPRLRVGGGALVAVTSAGLARYPAKDILSVAPKAAVHALVRAVAAEEGRFGVRANSVAPGVIEAGIFERLRSASATGAGGKADLDATWVAAAKRNAALKRFGTAEEVAEAVVFLASARASYITGQCLVVDGGYST